MSAYRIATDVEEIAKKIIAKDRKDLADARIVYLFIEKAPSSGGRITWGRARRIGGLNAVLAHLEDHEFEKCTEPDPFFVIEISEDVWVGLDADRRRALVDHELMHCRVDAEGDVAKYSMRRHDFEEFTAVIRRHGLWTSAADAMSGAVIEQLALALETVDETLTPKADEE